MSAPTMSRSDRDGLARRPWRGTVREYDLFKELTVALVVVGLVIVGLSAIVGSPDEPSVTLKSWAQAQPADFVATATAELGGTSETAGYGPPYNTTADATQTIGAFDLQSFSGVQLPIDTAKDIVITPLTTLNAPPSAALDTWNAASDTEKADWTAAYTDALTNAPDGDPAQVTTGDYGPVPVLTDALLTMASQGALDGVLNAQQSFYNADYTRTILFLGDGAYFGDLATAAHLTGDQWGMMNETGNTPGQSWLWLFSFWYQIEPFASAPNADLLVVLLMLLLSVLLTLVPFIPGLRDIPRWIPIHRLIWRDYYKKRAAGRS
ncbi:MULTISPECIES: hypothetical protein [unclassified Cryobacterium]|uniref:hypothetical protein n=1 Tax=unclassified Cryobacterium TaxID=2649013 RepID=UPI002AB461FD|nr:MULTISPECIES: hypothetical protein [unclassified Cryobacterium]MDY7543543.1 hypothetical protein [Cryobacterium sp. 5B3]MEA9999182.1 hypothetical protein [Cryobacterium sp. RTS3]MEB0267394.1 hypothetical protein [Cryobacterium sp. 10I5]MEB0273099.1 hypothetical protein [Cryobacterium sp. 5B3]